MIALKILFLLTPFRVKSLTGLNSKPGALHLMDGLTYKKAGVDIEEGDRFVSLISPMAKRHSGLRSLQISAHSIRSLNLTQINTNSPCLSAARMV